MIAAMSSRNLSPVLPVMWVPVSVLNKVTNFDGHAVVHVDAPSL